MTQRIYKACKSCNGAGSVPHYSDADTTAGPAVILYYTVCPDCNGSGAGELTGIIIDDKDST